MQVLAPSGSALFRRLLLALVTALIVARPIVLGEEPGLLTNLADPWGMTLTLLWLFAAVGWASWRFWMRPASQGSGGRGQGTEKTTASPPSLTPAPWPLNPTHWYGGLVQTALLVAVALVFVSAERAAAYKFPARMIAWDWFGLFVSFLVVRQLAVTPREQHGLFTVVLAGAVALAAQGIYQRAVEFPQNRQLAEDPETLRANWAEENPGQDINESLLQQVRQRMMEYNIFGPYAHPNSYAGFLVLWLPGLIGAIAVSRRMHVSLWQMVLVIGSAVMGLSALWLTHSRGALLGLAVAGAGIGFFVFRHALSKYTLAVLVGVVVLVGLVYGGSRSGLLASITGKSVNPITQRWDYWQTTWQMIRERPWLGVGPGNFSENYTRLMPPNSEEKIKDPHNFALEMWSTCGIFALLALLGALAVFFVRIVQGQIRACSVREEMPRADATGSDKARTPLAGTEEDAPVCWEFYIGGMFGLLLGFVLRVLTATPNAILTETYAAAMRSVVWFAAFALLERLLWTDRARVLALTAGIAAMLLNLCVSGGIGFPSVAGPLWVAVALALNAAALRPSRWLSRPGAAMILPLPIFLGLFLSYGMYILYPVLASDGLIREAVQNVAYYQTEGGKPPSDQSAGIRDYPERFIKRGVIDRLNQAAQFTPDDARIYVQLAWGTNKIWEISQRKAGQELPLDKRSLSYGVKAAQLDPHGAAGYLVQYQIHFKYAEFNEASVEALRKSHGDPQRINDREYTARMEYKSAAQVLQRYLPNDPHEAGLHYALWRAWSKASEKEKAREQAEIALQLNNLVTLRTRKLTDSQRIQLENWLRDLKEAAAKDGPKK